MNTNRSSKQPTFSVNNPLVEEKKDDKSSYSYRRIEDSDKERDGDRDDDVDRDGDIPNDRNGDKERDNEVESKGNENRIARKVILHHGNQAHQSQQLSEATGHLFNERREEDTRQFSKDQGEKATFQSSHKGQLIRYFLATGLCLGISQTMIMMGLKLSSSLEAAVWTPTTPIFTLILEYFFPALFFYSNGEGQEEKQRILNDEEGCDFESKKYNCKQEEHDIENKDESISFLGPLISNSMDEQRDSSMTVVINLEDSRNKNTSCNHVVVDESISVFEEDDDDNNSIFSIYQKTERKELKRKREVLTVARAGGILLTLIGCLTVILVDYYYNTLANDPSSPSSSSSSSSSSVLNKKNEYINDPVDLASSPASPPIDASNSTILLAHFCFFCGIFSTAGYVLFMKPLLQKLPPYTVTAGYYTIGALFLVPFLIIFQFISIFSTTLCPPATCSSYYDIPANAILPLIYLVFVTSILGYLLISYANTYLSGSLISSYSGLIPIFIFILKGIIYLVNKKEENGFNWGKLGILLVLMGLYIVAKDDKRNVHDLSVSNE